MVVAGRVLLWLMVALTMRSHCTTIIRTAASVTPPPATGLDDEGSNGDGMGNSQIKHDDVGNDDLHSTIRSSEPYGTFDKDNRDDCSSLIQYCQSDLYGHIFVQCAKTCTEYLQHPNTNMIGTVQDEDAFYNLPRLRLSGNIQYLSLPNAGNKLSTERFEGSVTVVALVPLLPGMAAYYYELFVHAHAHFQPHLEVVVIPIDLGQGLHIKERQLGPSSASLATRQSQKQKQRHVWVLEEESSIMKHPLVDFLFSVKPRNGNGTKNRHGNTVQAEINTDRVTMYILSADSFFVERIVSPSLQVVQEKVRTYVKSIDYKDL